MRSNHAPQLSRRHARTSGNVWGSAHALPGRVPNMLLCGPHMACHMGVIMRGLPTNANYPPGVISLFSSSTFASEAIRVELCQDNPDFTSELC